MATDVDVQFFSHLNGLNLGSDWGDLIRLLDTCLVNGLPLTSITSATVDGQGDINLTLFAEHNCLLFQIVELSGFAPSSFNGKYRIKGTPTTTTLILKSEKVGQIITTTGTAKLASLGYEIKFRDLSDVKRAYRAIDPTPAHPFIRVDESQSGEGGGTYTGTYAKSAMVGLVEDMTHIDDYADTSKLQLPIDTSDFSKNWKIEGTGTGVVRGWSKWYWATNQLPYFSSQESASPESGNRQFTLTGDKKCFYFIRGTTPASPVKYISGAGLFNSAHSSSVVSNWFLMTCLFNSTASSSITLESISGGYPLASSQTAARFSITKLSEVTPVRNTVFAEPILPDYRSGFSNLYSGSSIAALEIPFYDQDKILRGSLDHILYDGDTKNASKVVTSPLMHDGSMYVYDRIDHSGNNGGIYFYLGELE